MYSIGGWITMPGSCSKGFKSRPSMACGNNRSKGLDVNSMNRRKPILIRPITPSTRATIGSGKARLNTVTAIIQPDNINAQSSNEPSCEPQVAAKRYATGKWELELLATFATEKSLLINE